MHFIVAHLELYFYVGALHQAVTPDGYENLCVRARARVCVCVRVDVCASRRECVSVDAYPQG